MALAQVFDETVQSSDTLDHHLGVGAHRWQPRW